MIVRSENVIPDLGKRPLVMGIINATPDSFSGDGTLKHRDPVAAALERAERMIADGADLLDIGGESTRPGATPVSIVEETQRVRPVIAAIKKRFPTTPLSIDTKKAEVAHVSLAEGAHMINDVSALSEPAILDLAVSSGAYLILMHNRADKVVEDPRLGGHYEAPSYTDIVADVARELMKPFAAAIHAGVSKEKIILDPGLGFGKTVLENCALIRHLDKLKAMTNCPVMIGPSRKFFIGHILDLPVDDRLAGTAAAVTAAVLGGADILRVHDVKFMAHVIKMAAAIRHS